VKCHPWYVSLERQSRREDADNGFTIAYNELKKERTGK